MPSPPYMRFWPADYLGDTRHLTTQEHGAYLLLILAYWQNEGPLADDDGRMARLVGMTQKEWSRTKKTVAEFFQIAAGQWRHKRIEAELEHVRTKSKQASDAVRTRYGRTTDVPQTYNGRTTDVATDDLPYQSTEFRVRNTKTSSPEIPGPQRPGISPDRVLSEKPRARPTAIYPKLGEGPE